MTTISENAAIQKLAEFDAKNHKLVTYGGAFSIFLALTFLNWLGYLGSDDGTYAAGAYGWINEFPFVGGHGTIRHTITLPIALSFLIFGENEFALVLPTILYGLGLVFICTKFISSTAPRILVIAGVLVLTTHPNFIIVSSVVSADIIEAFFIFSSLYLFTRSIQESNTKLLFWAGACAGLGFLTRETTVFLLITYGLLFLAGFGLKRVYYFVMAAGFLAVWLAEVLYLTILTGDPLFRLNISANHDSTINRGIDLAGNLIIHPAVDPLITILLNQEFGLLFWIAIPATTLWFRRGRSSSEPANVILTPLLLLSVVWFVCVGAAYKLLPLNPRYFLISGIGFGILMIFYLQDTLQKYPIAVFGSLGLLLSTNIACIYLDNKQHMFAERQLVQVTEQYEGPIFTDKRTARKSDLLLKWAGTQDRVRTSNLEFGDLVYENLVPNRSLKIEDQDLGSFLEEKNYELQKLTQYEPDRRWLGRILVAIGLESVIPQSLMMRIYRGHPGAVLYEIVPLQTNSQ